MLDRMKFAAAAEQNVDTVVYAKCDCQAFVEKCAKEAGYAFNARGSNDIFRNYTEVSGSTSDASLSVGDVLFKWRQESNKLPSRYQGDGIGDMYHIGILTVAADGQYIVCHSANSRDNGKRDKFSSHAALADTWGYWGVLKNTVAAAADEDVAAQIDSIIQQLNQLKNSLC